MRWPTFGPLDFFGTKNCGTLRCWRSNRWRDAAWLGKDGGRVGEEGWRAGGYRAWIISHDLDTWLMTMVLFSSPKDTPFKSPKWFINGSDPNHLLYNWDDPPSGRKGRHFFQDRNIGGLIGLVLMKVIAEENYFTICKIQLMANWWFGARWFGILGVFLSSMFFFNHKRIPGIQTSGPQTTNWPFAERCWKRPWKSRDVQFRESLDMYTLTYGLWQIIFLTMETDWVLIPGENNISYSSVFSEFGSLLLQLLIPVVFTEPWYWYIFGSWLLFRRRVSSVALWDFPNKPNKQVVDGVTFSGPLKHGLLK